MLKKLLFLILFLSLAVSGWADDPPSWDLLDEDCSDISDWTNWDFGTGVSEISPAGQLRQTASPTSADNGADIDRDIGVYPDNYTIEIKLYCDALPMQGQGGFYFRTEDEDLRIQFLFYSDGLYVSTGVGEVEVGTDLVQEDTWQTWRFLATGTTPASATCDVYLNGDLVGDDVDCSDAGTYADGYTDIALNSDTVSAEIHLDYMKVATDLYAPTSEETTNLKLINNAQLNDCKF